MTMSDQPVWRDTGHCTDEDVPNSQPLPNQSSVEVPTVDSVCVIPGAGRGECWGCPVTTCVLWQNPARFLSDETQAVALKAAAQLASRQKVIQPATSYAQEDLPTAAASLIIALSDDDAQYRMKVDMAVESIIQDIHRSDTIKRRNQYTDRWMKGLKGRLPTPSDDEALDIMMDQADADVAAEHYDVKATDVLVRMRWFRKRRIVRLDRDV